MRFGKKGNLSPRYIEPFEVLEQVGDVAYKLSLPFSLSVVRLVFHVSMLKKDVLNCSHMLPYKLLYVRPDLTYEGEGVQILDLSMRTHYCREIPLVMVL